MPHSKSNKAQRLGQIFRELLMQGTEGRIVVSRIEPRSVVFWVLPMKWKSTKSKKMQVIIKAALGGGLM